MFTYLHRNTTKDASPTSIHAYFRSSQLLSKLFWYQAAFEGQLLSAVQSDDKAEFVSSPKAARILKVPEQIGPD